MSGYGPTGWKGCLVIVIMFPVVMIGSVLGWVSDKLRGKS